MRTAGGELVHSVRRIHRSGTGVQNEMAKMKVQHPKKHLLSYSAGPHNPVEENHPPKKEKKKKKRRKAIKKERDEMRREGVRGSSASHMKSPGSSRLSAELGSAGSSHMTHAWESIFQDLGQRRFHKMPHKLSFLSSPQCRVLTNKRDSVQWRNQPRGQLDVRLLFTDLTAPNLPHRNKYIDYAQGFGPICSFFLLQLVRGNLMDHCETLRIKKVKWAFRKIWSFNFLCSLMLCIYFKISFVKNRILDTFSYNPHVNCNRLPLALYSTSLKTIILGNQQTCLRCCRSAL